VRNFLSLVKAFVKRLFVKFGCLILKLKLTSDRDLINFLSFLQENTTAFELVRVGGDGDGGYLLPNDFEGMNLCFSPGVGENSRFEFDLVSKYGFHCWLADHSVSSPAIIHPRIHFTKKFVGVVNNYKYLRFDDWVEGVCSYNQSSELLLQMDIEGAEFGVLLDASDNILKRFRTIVVEFHQLEKMFDQNEFNLIQLTFKKLLKQFIIVHAHANNAAPVFKRGKVAIPSVIEFTFLRRDRVHHIKPLGFELHPLDQPNVPQNAAIDLSNYWSFYKNFSRRPIKTDNSQRLMSNI